MPDDDFAADARHAPRVAMAVRLRRQKEEELAAAMANLAFCLDDALEEGVGAPTLASWLPNPTTGRLGVTRDAVYKLIARHGQGGRTR